MNHLGLFEGIGGFSLAARWMNWETVAWCEWDGFCQKVLKHHFPEAEGHGNIKETDFTKYANRVDILTGGFPCQPYSTAGKRLGKEDDRHLWPEMLRAIREVSPRWVVGENVRGLTNWNGGLVFDEVQSDLETEGYEVTPFLLPACAVNAPHRRDRIWFVAYADSFGRKGLQCQLGELEKGRQRSEINEANQQHYATYAESIGQPGPRRTERQGNPKKNANWEKHRTYNACGWPTQSWVRRADDGIPGRLDGITFSEWARNSIKAYGNAIVPQVAYQIFKAIQQYETI